MKHLRGQVKFVDVRFFVLSLLQASRVIGTGTFGCGSVIVEGEDFIAENITFENNAPEVTFCSSCSIAFFFSCFFLF